MTNNKLIVVSPLGYTGIAYYDYSLCQSLSDCNLDVTLCTSDRWFLNNYNNKFKIIQLYKRCSGDKSKVIKGINYIISSFKIFLFIIKHKFMVAHFQILELPIIDCGLIISLKLLGIKIVLTQHDINHYKSNSLSKLINNLIFKCCDSIIVHKAINKVKFNKANNIEEKIISVVPHGGYEYFIDSYLTKESARNKLKLNQTDKIILFFGNIIHIKGLHVLIDALPLIKGEINNINLVIAGRVCDNINPKSISKHIQKNKVENNVTLNLGFIPDKDVASFYFASDLVILPYLEISESGVYKYAQTCGIPVVCSNLDEFQDSILHDQNGFLFNKNNSNDLANVIIDIFINDKINKFKRKDGKTRNSWVEISRQTKSIYLNVYNKKI